MKYKVNRVIQTSLLIYGIAISVIYYVDRSELLGLMNDSQANTKRAVDIAQQCQEESESNLFFLKLSLAKIEELESQLGIPPVAVYGGGNNYVVKRNQ